MYTATLLTLHIDVCDSPHTASALDAASHYGFDERANVFVLHSSFALCEAAPITAKLH